MHIKKPVMITTYRPSNEYSFWQMCKDAFKGYKDGLFLAKLLVIRDLQAKYKTSYLGYIWEIVPAITTAVIWIFLRGSGQVELAETSIPFPAFVLIGTLMWSVITDSFSKPLQIFTQNTSIITKINIPKEGVLLISFFNVIINQGIKMILIILILLFYQLEPSLSLLYFFPVLVFTIIFFLSLGVLLMPLEYMLPDISRVKNMGMTILMFFTPVVYEDSGNGFLSEIMRLNPLTYIICALRNSLSGLPVEHPYLLVSFCFLTVFIFFLATILNRIMSPIVIQRISA